MRNHCTINIEAMTSLAAYGPLRR